MQEARHGPTVSRVSPHDPLLPALLAVPVALGGWLAVKIVPRRRLVGLLAAAIPLGRGAAVLRPARGRGPLVVLDVRARRTARRLLDPGVPRAARRAARDRRGPGGAQVLVVPRRGWAVAGGNARRAPVALGEDAPVVDRVLAGDLSLFDSGGAVTVVCWCVAARGARLWLLLCSLCWAPASGTGDGPPTPQVSHFARRRAHRGRDPIPTTSVAACGCSVCSSTAGFGLAAWQPCVPPRRAGSSPRSRSAAGGLGHARGPLRGRDRPDATFVALTMHGWWWPGRQVVVVAAVRGARGRGGGLARVPAGTRARRGRSRAPACRPSHG